MADNTSDRGLGSPNMSESKKQAIRRKGGEATGAKNLSKEDRAKGGRHSHSGGRRNEE